MTATATSVIQKRNSDMVELLKPDFVGRSELTYLTAVDKYLRLPCLRFLGLGGLGSAGEWRDQSGNAMDLTYNGNPRMGFTTQGAPYFAYDGTGDYHYHVDNAHFDVTGTETTVLAAQNGLTWGAWVYFNNAIGGTNEHIIGKHLTTGNQRSYIMIRSNTTGAFTTYVSVDGTATVNIANGTLSATTWYFLCGRFIPSTTLKSWRNDTTATLAAGVPASIFNGTSPFDVNGMSGTFLFAGNEAFPFVCACALSNELINQLYQSSRGLFGV